LYGPASTLHAIQLAAQDAGHFVNIVSLDSLERGPVLDAVDRLRGQGVDGIIVIAPEVAAAQALGEIPPDLPAVVAEGLMTAPIPVVGVDQQAGATKATSHLLDLGHRTVWHITGPSDWYEARAREQGWRSALERAGAPVPESIPGDWSPQSGYRQGKRLITADEEVTALFVANDQMALGVMRALFEAGLEVPRDMSLVGFDDIPEAAYYAPPLTTVRQEFREVGTKAVAMLLRQLRGSGDVPEKHVVEPDLVVRASTAPPR
jgi:DNA-binding LacI/PurR family transcriptional regulator